MGYFILLTSRRSKAVLFRTVDVSIACSAPGVDLFLREGHELQYKVHSDSTVTGCVDSSVR